MWAMRLYSITDDMPVYLQTWNVDAGPVQTTSDLAKARTWCTQHEVLLAWMAQSTVAPTRPDGKPHRPLTVYGMAAVPV